MSIRITTGDRPGGRGPPRVEAAVVGRRHRRQVVLDFAGDLRQVLGGDGPALVVPPVAVDGEVVGARSPPAGSRRPRPGGGTVRCRAGRWPRGGAAPGREGVADDPAHALGHQALALVAGERVVAQVGRPEVAQDDVADVDDADDVAARRAAEQEAGVAGRAHPAQVRVVGLGVGRRRPARGGAARGCGSRPRRPRPGPGPRAGGPPAVRSSRDGCPSRHRVSRRAREEPGGGARGPSTGRPWSRTPRGRDDRVRTQHEVEQFVEADGGVHDPAVRPGVDAVAAGMRGVPVDGVGAGRDRGQGTPKWSSYQRWTRAWFRTSTSTPRSPNTAAALRITTSSASHERSVGSW